MEIHLAQYPKMAGSISAVHRAGSAGAEDAIPGANSYKTRRLLQRTLYRVEQLAREAHNELLTGQKPRQRNGHRKVDLADQLEQAVHWQAMFGSAEQKALRYGRD